LIKHFTRFICSKYLFIKCLFQFIFKAPAQLSYTSPIGEIRNITLPDGSEVVLNAESTLKFLESNWDEGRVVYLDGKAHFEVVKGSTFSVTTGEYKTSVLGTSFDVDHRYNHFAVYCYSGSVSITKKDEQIDLVAGEKAIMESTHLIKAVLDDMSIERWISGEFHFSSEPLNKVVDELQRQFGIDVVGLRDDHRIYRGYFYKDNLTEALDLVFKPMGYDYKINGDVVTLK
ncbi:MAG: FecR domain-containing protein, partial [Bacteroidetes bacterium]|nr:FecR domain-containing protein [Bacteroidota bacterium]MDA1120126.1 FecR domain-containing protein [Bacteroidota bacterium]